MKVSGAKPRATAIAAGSPIPPAGEKARGIEVVHLQQDNTESPASASRAKNPFHENRKSAALPFTKPKNAV
jgi:hypothetical protein